MKLAILFSSEPLKIRYVLHSTLFDCNEDDFSEAASCKAACVTAGEDMPKSSGSGSGRPRSGGVDGRGCGLVSGETNGEVCNAAGILSDVSKTK